MKRPTLLLPALLIHLLAACGNSGDQGSSQAGGAGAGVVYLDAIWAGSVKFQRLLAGP